MTIRNQNVKIYQGDTVTLFVALTQADGTPFDPSLNAVIKWRLLRNAYDSAEEAVVKKDLGSGITVVTAPIKGVNITLNASDTNLPKRLYHHELKIWDVNDVTTAMNGLVNIKRAVQMLKGNVVSPAPKQFSLSGSVPVLNAAVGFPGQTSNPVGFAVAPGYPGSLTPASGPFTSGTAGNPTIIAYKDFDAGVSSTNIDADYVTFIGCRFKSNNVAGNNVSSGGTGAHNITFSYCSFTPRTTLYSSPPGAAWPSAGAGLQSTTFVTDVNCINGNSGYQFGMDVRNLADGPITWDHCDFWGFGNAINFVGSTAQMTIRDCWFHDSANTSPQSYHNDGPGYLNGGLPPHNILADHNTIASIGTTNAWAFQDATSPYVNIVVTRNFFSGFNICVDMCHNVAGSNGLVFSDNIFGTDLPWVNGPLSGASMFVSNGSPVNVWRRNKFRVLPGTSTIAGQQFSWVAGDDGKFMLPGGTLSATDYAG